MFDKDLINIYHLFEFNEISCQYFAGVGLMKRYLCGYY